MNSKMGMLKFLRVALLVGGVLLGRWASGQGDPGAVKAHEESPSALAAGAASGVEAAEPAQDHPGDEVNRPAGRETIRIDQVVSVGGDARVARDQVAEGVVVVRGDAEIEGDVDGDVVVVLGRLKVTGKVRGDVVVVMGDADIDGEVRGDLAMVLTRGRLGPKANIRGHTAAVGVPPVIESGAKVRGRPEIVNLGPLVGYVDRAKEYLFQGVFMLRPFPPGVGWVWTVAAMFLAFHLLISVLFGGAVRGAIETLRERPARSFLVGLLTCVLVGPLSVLLSFTVVAVPLIWLAYLLLCVFGRVAVYGAAGAGALRLRGETLSPFLSVLVGSLLFYASYMVPVLGFCVYWIVLPWGVGAVLIRLGESLRRETRGSIPPGVSGSAGFAPGMAPGGSGPAGAAAQAIASGSPGPATQTLVDDPGSVVPGPGLGQAGGMGMGAPGVAGSGPSTPPLKGGGLPGGGLNPIELAAMPRAGFWLRFAAMLIDLTVVAFVNAMTFQTGKALWLLLAGYHLVMWSWKGTTLGGSILGLRLIRIDGRALDWQTCAYRLLGCVVSMLPLGLGFFWVAWDAECQSWHDRIAGTTLVRADRQASLTRGR